MRGGVFRDLAGSQKLWLFSAATDEGREVATLLSGALFCPCCHKSGLHQENKRDIYELLPGVEVMKASRRGGGQQRGIDGLTSSSTVVVVAVTSRLSRTMIDLYKTSELGKRPHFLFQLDEQVCSGSVGAADL